MGAPPSLDSRFGGHLCDRRTEIRLEPGCDEFDVLVCAVGWLFVGFSAESASAIQDGLCCSRGGSESCHRDCHWIRALRLELKYRRVSMITEIGLMIGAYIFVRMLSLI